MLSKHNLSLPTNNVFTLLFVFCFYLSIVVYQCQSLHCFCSRLLDKQTGSHYLFCWKCSRICQHVLTDITRQTKVNTSGDRTKSKEGTMLHTGLLYKSFWYPIVCSHLTRVATNDSFNNLLSQEDTRPKGMSSIAHFFLPIKKKVFHLELNATVKSDKKNSHLRPPWLFSYHNFHHLTFD